MKKVMFYIIMIATFYIGISNVYADSNVTNVTCAYRSSDKKNYLNVNIRVYDGYPADINCVASSNNGKLPTNCNNTKEIYEDIGVIGGYSGIYNPIFGNLGYNKDNSASTNPYYKKYGYAYGEYWNFTEKRSLTVEERPYSLGHNFILTKSDLEKYSMKLTDLCPKKVFAVKSKLVEGETGEDNPFAYDFMDAEGTYDLLFDDYKYAYFGCGDFMFTSGQDKNGKYFEGFQKQDYCTQVKGFVYGLISNEKYNIDVADIIELDSYISDQIIEGDVNSITEIMTECGEAKAKYCDEKISSYNKEECQKATDRCDNMVDQGKISKISTGLIDDLYNRYAMKFSADDCESLLGFTDRKSDPAYYLQFVFNLMKYAGIILLLVLTIIDLVKYVLSGSQDGMKKIGITAVKRLIICVVIFFLPILIKYLLELFGIYGSGTCNIK